MLPFLKNRDAAVGVNPVETIERKADDDNFDTLDAVVDDLMRAFEKKDRKLLKGALSALVDHIQAHDIAQGELTFEGE